MNSQNVLGFMQLSLSSLSNLVVFNEKKKQEEQNQVQTQTEKKPRILIVCNNRPENNRKNWEKQLIYNNIKYQYIIIHK